MTDEPVPNEPREQTVTKPAVTAEIVVGVLTLNNAGTIEHVVKGVLEGISEAGGADERFVRDQWARWLQRLTTIGLPLSTLEGWDVWPCVAIRIRVTALFNQTPGPNAGVALS